MKKDEDYIKKDFTHGVQGLMPGDVGLVDTVGGNWFENFFGWGIKLITASKVCHAFLYFGSGKHEIIEAQAGGVKKAKLEANLNKRTQILVYRNKNLNIQKLALLKAYAYGSVGKSYDFAGLVSFVTDTGDTKEANFCSELVVESYNCAGLKSSDKPSGKTSPGDLRKFFNSPEGKNLGWFLWDSYNINA